MGLSATILVGLAVMILAYRLGRWRAWAMHETSLIRYCLTLLFLVAAMFVPLWARDFIGDALSISGTTLAVVKFLTNVVFLLTVMVVLVGASSRAAELIIASPRIHPKGLDAQFIRITSRVLGLAAQDTLKNLFGSMMIILDRPYRVGERIVVKDYDGVVEEIGLRSTKIRLLTGHLATIPNEDMARSDIENIGRRPHIRRIADIRIPLDTPREKLQRAVDIIRAALKDHEGMDPELPPRVYFTEFQPNAFNIRVIYWYTPPMYWDYLAFSEKLNMEIFRAFDEQGIRFSLPARLTYEGQSDQTSLELKLVGNAAPAHQLVGTTDKH